MRKSKPRRRLAMYGISRIDDDKHRTHAWRVSLRRQGRMHVKNFPDRKHGGKTKALRLAIAYRDSVVAQIPPTTRKQHCSVLRRNNKTGISGVCVYNKPYFLKDGTVRELRYWEANWPGEQGEYMTARFSVSTYGERVARHMAIRAREKGLAKVKGPFWASERGEALTREKKTKPTQLRRAG